MPDIHEASGNITPHLGGVCSLLPEPPSSPLETLGGGEEVTRIGRNSPTCTHTPTGSLLLLRSGPLYLTPCWTAPSPSIRKAEDYVPGGATMACPPCIPSNPSCHLMARVSLLISQLGGFLAPELLHHQRTSPLPVTTQCGGYWNLSLSEQGELNSLTPAPPQGAPISGNRIVLQLVTSHHSP